MGGRALPTERYAKAGSQTAWPMARAMHEEYAPLAACASFAAELPAATVAATAGPAGAPPASAGGARRLLSDGRYAGGVAGAEERGAGGTVNVLAVARRPSSSWSARSTVIVAIPSWRRSTRRSGGRGPLASGGRLAAIALGVLFYGDGRAAKRGVAIAFVMPRGGGRVMFDLTGVQQRLPLYESRARRRRLGMSVSHRPPPGSGHVPASRPTLGTRGVAARAAQRGGVAIFTRPG
jgi:hypothetical protein